ncbi:MAG: hypothetical protein CVV42_03905 [Candidatus Riflebacteria bacterium HGW-Riflebacteria-2]|jgi:hypothetical protein|nr:MAG: hypothetical protein CVV42_03905 [Candidatus Riflebacteria bacterium HGW-Riflebacteria-2]
MPPKTTIIALMLIVCGGDQVLPQTITRWHRIPGHGQPQIIRHPLEHADQPGELFRFSYETPPVKPMMRRLRRGFSELFPEPVPEESYIDISRSTQKLEELDNEADNALELGYEKLDTDNDISIFDPDRLIVDTATGSLDLLETTELAPATFSFPVAED